MTPKLSEVSPRTVDYNALERELGDFSYIVSHDLATEFRHVSEFSKLLLDPREGSLTGSQQGYAEHVLTATERCQRMMEELLIYSQIQQKTLILEPQNITRLMETAYLQLSGEIHDANADILIEPLGLISADGELVVTAFKHLLQNSIKFRRRDVACIIRVRAAHENGVLAVEVKDNGIGVPKDQFAKVFRMFHRLHPEGTGMGVGLPISRRIARRHGGDVRFREVQSGACVRIVLPAEMEA